jgi:glutamate-1-semialdehyde 2,1-aminomutase
VGSMYTLFFTGRAVTDFESAKTSDTLSFGRYFQAMLKRGVYLAPSQFESLFLSTALKEEHLERIIQANEESLKEILE